MTQHLSEADVRGIAEYTRIGLDAEEGQSKVTTSTERLERLNS